MPLEDHIPVIDDRTYADIVDEARARIPRYTPEWTDFNESDPGITLVELFAWLSELQIFRMNQVPLLNYLKFLELVGIELDPARPATARITFPLAPAFPQPVQTIPRLTQIATEEPDADGPILFELDRAITAIRARLDAVQSFDGFVFRDLGTVNAAVGDPAAPLTPQPFLAFGTAFGPDAALYLGFSEELPDASFALTFWSERSDQGIPVLRCEGSAAFETSRLAWEVWDGREWQALTVLKDDSQALTRTGEVSLRGPARNTMQARTVDQIAGLFWLRARVTRNDFQRPPSLRAIRTNTAAASQAETIEFESVGGSTGEASQTFALGDAPVLPGSLKLEVDEGRGYLTWEEVPDFAGLGPDARVYVLNRATGEIRFGDGRDGQIPVGNPQRPRNIRARSYQVGGGVRGNVAAGQLTAIQGSIGGVDSDAVTNLFPAAGGTDEEQVEAAIQRAPTTLKSRERAVASEDFEELAKRAANIARARALPLYHPDYPGIEVPGVVTVVVVPATEDAAPMPTEGTLNAVCAILNERRLLTTEIYVTGPVYETVTVTADLIVEDDADLAEVKEGALGSLALYFDPLEGGESSDPDLPADDPDRSGGGWPFGGDIFYSLLYKRLLRRGVRRIQSLTIALGDDEFGECRDAPVPRGTLLVSGAHRLDVRYDDPDAEAAP